MASLQAEFAVTGMTCNGCARTIERKLTSTPGVSAARVNLELAKATVEYDPERTDMSRLVSAVESLGYQVPGGSQTA
jgi:copper chaperone CopZ